MRGVLPQHKSLSPEGGSVSDYIWSILLPPILSRAPLRRMRQGSSVCCKSIRTLIFYQGSYAHRLAQRRGLSAGCALDGFVGGKGFCPFSAPCFAASARDLRGMPDFSPSPHVTQKTRARRAFLRGAEKRIRTSGRVTPVTRFPIVLLKPLRHLCK